MPDFNHANSVSESPAMLRLSEDREALPVRLRYAPDVGTTVEFLDTAGLDPYLHGRADDIPVLHGQLHSGRLFTVLNSFADRLGCGLTGIADVRLTANVLLVGMHIHNTTDSVFHRITAYVNGLEEWIATPCIFHDFRTNKTVDGRRAFHLTCEAIDPLACEPDTDGPILSLDQTIGVRGPGPTEATVDTRHSLCLQFQQPIDLDQCRFELFRLQAFISLLCGHEKFFDRVQLSIHTASTPDSHQDQQVEYLPAFIRPHTMTRVRSRVLLTLPVLKPYLPTLWSEWLSRFNKYSSALELFLSTELYGGQLTQFRFLAITQALESLHRARFGGTYIENGLYSSITQILSDAIPCSVPKDLRDALKSRIKYGNEFSLRRRLQQLTESIDTEIRNIMHGNLSAFINQVIDTRNYLTHYPSDAVTRVLDGIELHDATRLLRWLFLVVILEDIGVSSGVLAPQLRDQTDLTQARNRLSRRA